jgi:asparagine synthase (glutamine-hydrolysing)
MCGISGWSIHPNSAATLSQDADTFTAGMTHRGPDSTGQFHSRDYSIYLGHNRLSIIDLTDGGHQPMTNEQGDVMVLNGELYNYQTIRTELEQLGHQFNSASDTEVAIKAFHQWGLSFTEKLKGMYAIAIWSQREQCLHLFRDPLGIKPLYYWRLPNDQGFAFASEIRTFQNLSTFTTEVDRRSLDQFLEFGYSFSPETTIFNGVSKLQPGHRLEIKQQSASAQIRFYNPDLRPLASSLVADSEQQLFETLSTVVAEHLIADVPVGLLLSGGLDSSLIAALASKKEKIHTFSMGFSDSTTDERPYARIVSKHIGSIHQEISIGPEEILTDLETVAAHYDDLFADWGMISTRVLYSKCKAQDIKVVLVGEGADELFGGYDIFKQSLSTAKRPMDWVLFQLYRHYAGRRYGGNFVAYRKIMKGYLKQCGNDLFSAIRLFESRNQVPNNYAMKVDKASMSLSLEARAPFLDSRIADIAYRLPRDQLINLSDEKLILKSMARRYKLLPDEILDRRKFGAGIASNWMVDSPSFRQYARDIILANDSWVDELNLRDAMQRFFRHGQSGYAFPRSISLFSNLAWRLLILSLWSKALALKPS